MFRFDSETLPNFQKAAGRVGLVGQGRRNKTFGEDPAGFLSFLDDLGADTLLDELMAAHRFDCTRIPVDFVMHTAEEAVAEMQDGAAAPRLPFDGCLFEFAEFDVFARTLSDGDKEELGDPAFILDVIPFGATRLFNVTTEIVEPDEFRRRYQPTVEYHPVDIEAGGRRDEKHMPVAYRGAMLTVGLLTLMEERLLLNRKVNGAGSTKNARRAHKNEGPLLPYRIVTLNLAETRRRAKRATLRAHESPRLHWRRGHWRTLHRLSEFESRTWVRRCLVGDPDKGFVPKHYRAVWQPTIH